MSIAIHDWCKGKEHYPTERESHELLLSDDGLYYLAMEYLTGMDLSFLVERFGPVPAARAVNFIKQACLALEEAHGAGIIHRDIKPHNLFVTRAGNDPDFIKLLDSLAINLCTPAAGSRVLDHHTLRA